MSFCVWNADFLVMLRKLLSKYGGKYTSGPRYWNVPVLANTGMSQHWWILEHFWLSALSKNVIFTFFRTSWCYQKLTILECKTVKYCSVLAYLHLGLEVYFLPWIFPKGFFVQIILWWCMMICSWPIQCFKYSTQPFIKCKSNILYCVCGFEMLLFDVWLFLDKTTTG